MEHGGRDTFDHKRYNSTEQRKQFNAKYTTTQWRKLRQIQLSKHPLCASCLTDGKIVQAEHIDHLFPWSSIGEEAFYHNVFQSLCESCHSIKTTLEKRGIYRRFGFPNKDYALGDYGNVMQIEKNY
jgi:5-methylcytosine-specific restriction protein A